MKQGLSIIIPIHNEEAILRNQVISLLSQLEQTIHIPYEILLVENGSTDETPSIARLLATYHDAIHHIWLPNASYGGAVRAGLQRARYPVVVQFDIDFWDVMFLRRALTLIDDYDMVIGSKNIPGSIDARPLGRRITSKLFEYCIAVRFNLPIADTHGVKVMLREKVLPLMDTIISPNHFFDTELVIRAIQGGCISIELPVAIHEIRKSRFPFRKRFFQVFREFVTLIMQPLGLARFSSTPGYQLMKSI